MTVVAIVARTVIVNRVVIVNRAAMTVVAQRRTRTMTMDLALGRRMRVIVVMTGVAASIGPGDVVLVDGTPKM